MIHIRGTAHPTLVDYVRDVAPDGFLARLERDGRVHPLEPTVNAVTATNLASFETGTYPSGHGIVGHQFSTAEVDYAEPVSGFAELFDRPTLAERAGDAGLRVLSVGSLLLHGSTRQAPNVDVIAQGEALGEASVRHLHPVRSTALELPAAPPGFGSLMADASGSPTLRLYDGVDLWVYGPAPAERRYLIDTDGDPASGDETIVALGDWAELEVGQADGRAVAVRLTVQPTSEDTAGCVLFVRAPFAHRGYPAELVREVERAVGMATGWPSLGAYFDGSIERQLIVEEIDAEVAYVTDLIEFGLNAGRYDLITADYPLIDRYGHLFLTAADSDSSPSRALESAYGRLDRDLEQLTRLAAERGFEVVIASGHGFSAIHTSIRLENTLRETLGAELAKTVRAVQGKVSAHVYARGAPPEAIERIADSLRSLTDPATGESVVEQVYRASELAALGLDHPNSGDLFVLLRPGYVFEPGAASEGPLFDRPNFRGDHGYASQHPESLGVFVAPDHGFDTDEPLRVVDVAPSVAALLGLERSPQVDGRPRLR